MDYNKKREHLPLFKQVENLRFDIVELRRWVDALLNTSSLDDINSGPFYEQMISYRQELRSWFLTPEELDTSSVGELKGTNYRQINLSDFDSTKSLNNVSRDRNSDTDFTKVRRATRPTHPSYIPEADERNYTIPNDNCSDYVRSIVLPAFRGVATRARLAVMEPGFSITPHIDNNTDYSVRYHIPIYTNNQCNFYVKPKDHLEFTKFNMIADGSTWFLNTGHCHYADNLSPTKRIHLIITCVNQQDLYNNHEIQL
jgi:hypothetical protein